MHKPTFFPAVGGRNEGGNLRSIPSAHECARSLPSHTVLKRRKTTEVNYIEKRDLIEKINKDPDLNVLFPENLAADPEDADITPDGSEGEDDKEGSVKSEEALSGEESSGNEDEELARELEAIKKERELKAAAEVKTDRERQLEILTQNLRQGKTTIERDWTEDTVFSVPVQRSEDQTYINDTIRSAFHKRFLQRYIR